MKNLQELPKLRDSITYLYLEHAAIEQNDAAIIAIDVYKRQGHACRQLYIPCNGLSQRRQSVRQQQRQRRDDSLAGG